VPEHPLDWDRALQTAEAESLAPAVAFAFRGAHHERVPSAVHARLRRHFVEATARHLVLTGELARLLKSFACDDVPVMPLKGPVLAENFYPDAALRPFTDLDLLTRREHVERVDDLLRRLGYRRIADDHSFDFDVAYDRATLYRSPSGVHVDLHWSLLSEPRYSWNESEAQRVWDRAVPIQVAGEEALSLCPEDLFLYLCVHLAVHHSLAGLLWYYDLFLILERWGDRIDWEAVRARASRWHVRAAAYFALRELARLFDARIPAEVIADLRPRGPRAAVMTWLLRHREDAQRRAAEHVIGLLLVDRGRDVFGTLRRIVVPRPDWMAARYEDAGGSRVRQYAAHYRRIGEVMNRAVAGLRPRRRASKRV
jgi:hypothetical protein